MESVAVHKLSERIDRQLQSSSGDDPGLADELAAALQVAPGSAALRNLQGSLSFMTNPIELGPAASAFQDAWTSDPRHVVAGANLAEVLVLMQQKEHAVEQVRRTLAMLDRANRLSADVLVAPYLGVLDAECRAAWNAAGQQSAGDPSAEDMQKRRLIRWRLHRLAAKITGDLVHHYEAYTARPDLAASGAALGAALARAGRPMEAVRYLQAAVPHGLLDRNTVESYAQALGQLGRFAEQKQVVKELIAGGADLPVTVAIGSEGAGPTPPIANPPLRIVWQGGQRAIHSLALVNREICSRLDEHGHELSLIPPTNGEPEDSAISLSSTLQQRCSQQLGGPAHIHVTHQWPPDFRKPPHGRFVVIQPWEFGSLPRAWIAPLNTVVDKTWVPSGYVRECFIASGVRADRVQVVPNGVSSVFFQEHEPLPLATQKRFKFLFVGGTIARKGIDLLLKAFHQVFSAEDDVCLVIKDMGRGTFYQGQTAEALIASYQNRPHAPEVHCLTSDLSPEDMARLYASCHCLVHPYRGEGFGLPIAEALASGLPVIATGYGAALDFCREEHAYLLPAGIVRFSERRVGDLETVDFPWWAEPDQDALRYYLRHVSENPQEARAKGNRGREFIRNNFTWDHAAAAVEERLAALVGSTLSPGGAAIADGAATRPRVSLTMIVKNEEHNLPACLDSVADLVNEIIIVDTGSTDGTVALAEQRGAKVFHFPWIDSFAAARNEALRHATGQWIFWMDADDRLDEANRQKLQQLFANLPDEFLGFVMKCSCLPDPESGTATVVHHVRLFPNHPDLSWKYRIHEQILGSIRRLGGQVSWSDVVIQHVGYQDAGIRKTKLERDLRLLNLEYQENPSDPFTLFNLGSVFLEQNQPGKAIAVLQESLRGSKPCDSIVRKLYSMLAQSHRLLGHLQQSHETCEEGRKYYPQDPEILFQQSIALKGLGRLEEAIACLKQVMEEKEGTYFASVDSGLRGCKGHHNLAVLYVEMGKAEEAERQWRLGFEHEPSYLPSLLGLSELYLKSKRHEELDELLGRIEQHPHGRLEAQLFRARQQLAAREYSRARDSVERVLHEDPRHLQARVILSHILLKEAKDWQAAEEALRAILALDPDHREAQTNLQVLLGQRQRPK